VKEWRSSRCRCSNHKTSKNRNFVCLSSPDIYSSIDWSSIWMYSLYIWCNVKSDQVNSSNFILFKMCTTLKCFLFSLEIGTFWPTSIQSMCFRTTRTLFFFSSTWIAKQISHNFKPLLSKYVRRIQIYEKTCIITPK